MVGRKRELKFLEEQYNVDKNRLVVIYGRRGIGKTTLITEFLKDKKAVYYQAKDCSEREQKLLLKSEWELKEGIVSEGEDYIDSFNAALSCINDNEKLIIVIDEVYLALKQGGELLEAFTALWDENKGKNNLMLIIATSSVQWAENNMVKTLGKFAMNISAFKKLPPFGFLEITSRFPDLSSKEEVYIYGILGGIPGYMDMWDEKLTLRDNIIKLFLRKDSLLYSEPERFLKGELRELALYNTILANLAAGRQKLNNLYDRTGFSRAKISVYLKNLIELDIVEKVFSYDAKNHENVQKGVYGIKDPLMHFWYRYVFPNLSALEKGEAEFVYDTVIAPDLNNYLHKYFVKVCKEYFDLLNMYKKLPIQYELCESWYGKDGVIDLIAKDVNSNEIIIGKCKWSGTEMAEDDFEDLLATMAFSGIDADYYYLFSDAGFSESLMRKSNMIDNLILTDLNSF